MAHLIGYKYSVNAHSHWGSMWTDQYDGLVFAYWRKKELLKAIITPAPCWIALSWLIRFNFQDAEVNNVQVEGHVKSFTGRFCFLHVSLWKKSMWQMNEGYKVEVRGQHLPEYTLNIWFWVPTRKCKVEKYLHETLLVSQLPCRSPCFPWQPRVKCYKHKSSIL